jgi:hypothetical protein
MRCSSRRVATLTSPSCSVTAKSSTLQWKSLAVEPQRRDVGKPRGRGEDEAVVDHFAGDIGPRIDTAGALHFAAHELRRIGGMRAEWRAPTDVDTATAVGLEREVVVEVKVHAELVSAENRPMAG